MAGTLRKHRVLPSTGGGSPPGKLDGLREKLAPGRLRLSGKMRALVDFVLGERHTEPWVAGLSVTSDGFVILHPASESGQLHDELLGSSDELYSNYAGVLCAAEVTGEEGREFYDRYAARANDPDPTPLATSIVSAFAAARRRSPARPHGVCEGRESCTEHERDSSVTPCK